MKAPGSLPFVIDSQEVLEQAMEASEIPTISLQRTYEEDQKTCCEVLLQSRVPRLGPAKTKKYDILF